MKLLLTAIALAISVPAAAQTGAPAQSPAQSAPAQPAPHADHAMPGMNHADHDNCCKMKSSDGKAMDCCEKMKSKDGKMDCCEKMKAGDKPADSHADHHQGSH